MKIQVPAGFLFSATAAAIKLSGRPDMAYAEAPHGASAAALFTRNLVVAAPVEVGRDHLRQTAGRVRAVVVNAGNANCGTGKEGRRAAVRVCQEAARQLQVRPEWIIPSSTGIIGVPLPVEKLIGGLPALLQQKSDGEQAVRCFAEAIMTTDTRPKIASFAFEQGDRLVSVMGIAKGSGMIAPNLATMLVYLFTDIEATPAALKPLLRKACDDSFNCISVDHDTSTNDTVLLLASGKSGVRLTRARQPFAEALNFVCRSLAEQIVGDGEGIAHVARLHVEGARNRTEAMTIARSIAGSMLVKTALAGSDPNWGRILAAVGYAGVKLDPARVSIYIGPQMVCRNGQACPFDATEAHRYLSQPSYDIRVQLNRGKAGVEFLTTDLTAEYVRINADYST